MFQATHSCHCEPVRAWQSSLMRYVGCPSDEEVAGWFRWIAASLALLAMTKGGRNGRGGSSHGLGIASPKAVIASPAGRGNPVGDVMRDGSP